MHDRNSHLPDGPYPTRTFGAGNGGGARLWPAVGAVAVAIVLAGVMSLIVG